VEKVMEKTMEQKWKKYHKEYLSISEISKEKSPNLKKYLLYHLLFGVIYSIFLLIRFFKFSIWITLLIFIGGLCSLPFFNHQENFFTKSYFLVIDSKYIQFKNQLMIWDAITKVLIYHEVLSKDKKQFNFNISLKCSNGKTIYIDTFYFQEQEEIVKGIMELAKRKNIPVICKAPQEF
jgi:hypothetical protein